MPAVELASGVVISDRYRLTRLLGEGGMGAVWEATHSLTRKSVALKFLKAAPENAQARRRFLREARAASAVQHPNVVEIHDIIEHEGMPVMVMDLLIGESLAQKLARDQRIPLRELAELMLPVVSAIGTAHAAGVVHRDIKPDNVFLEKLPTGEIKTMVLDFGIAKLNKAPDEAAATANLTRTGAVMGTPYYMAPEQVFGEKDVDHRADVWSVGVMLYECLSGTKPVDGDNVGQMFKTIVTGNMLPLEQRAPDLPADIAAVIGRMLVVDRDARAPDLRELYETLKRYGSANAVSFGSAADVTLTGDTDAHKLVVNVPSTDGVSSSVESKAPPPAKSSRWMLIGALAVVVLGGTGALVTQLGGRDEQPEAPSATASAEPVEAAAPTTPVETTVAPPASVAPPEVDASTGPTRKHVGGKPLTGKPDAKAPVPSATVAPTSTRLPGQVVEDAPF
jgi:serine/threonine-protein kinase